MYLFREGKGAKKGWPQEEKTGVDQRVVLRCCFALYKDEKSNKILNHKTEFSFTLLILAHDYGLFGMDGGNSPAEGVANGNRKVFIPTGVHNSST